MAVRKVSIAEIDCDRCGATASIDIDPAVGHRVKPAGWVRLSFHEKLPHKPVNKAESYKTSRNIDYQSFDICAECADHIKTDIKGGTK